MTYRGTVTHMSHATTHTEYEHTCQCLQICKVHIIISVELTGRHHELDPDRVVFQSMDAPVPILMLLLRSIPMRDIDIKVPGHLWDDLNPGYLCDGRGDRNSGARLAGLTMDRTKLLLLKIA